MEEAIAAPTAPDPEMALVAALRHEVETLRIERERLQVQVATQAENVRNCRRDLRLQHIEMRHVVERLQTLAMTDEVTGLYNRRAFREQLVQQVARSRRTQAPLALLILDLDNYKQVNDIHGHPAGDAILRLVADSLKEKVRAAGFLARYGGDEFVLLLPDTDTDGCLILAERLRDAIETTNYQGLCLTISIGAAQYLPEMQDEVELIAAADRALYTAKATGRNRIIVSDETLGEDDPMLAAPVTLESVIEKEQERALADLAALCALPSVSAKGESLEPCAEMVAALMWDEGLVPRIIPVPGGPPVVFGEAVADDPHAPTVLFYNHYDVQPAEPLELWESPPFELTIRDGKAFARGVADDKGHIISRLLALRAIRAINGGKYPFHIKFLVEGEEEVGSPHLGAWIEQNVDMLKADFCIWEEGGTDNDGNPFLYCGMRGIAYFELTVKTIAYDAHSGSRGSLLPNAAWRLVWALASLKDMNERILLPDHYASARLASLRDLELLAALPNEDAYLREQFGLPEGGFLGGVQTQGTELQRRAVFEPTLTICGLDSGWQGAGAKTVLPAEAKAKMDFRLVPDQDPDTVHASLRKHLDAQGFSDIEIQYLGGQRPARVDPDHPLVQLAAQTAETVYGKSARITPLIGGSGPMWWFSGYLGLPVTSPGIEYPGVRVHAPNENIRLTDFTLGTLHLAHLLSRIEEARTG